MTEPIIDVFGDSRWRQIGPRLYYGEIEGRKMGAVLATWSPHHCNFAVNRRDFERLIAAKRDDKIDDAVVVAARRNGTGSYESCCAVNAEGLYERLLRTKSTIDGGFGPFWTLAPYEIEGGE